MQRLRTLLDVSIDAAEIPDHEELTANRKVVTAAAREVLGTLVKVDENRLRAQTIDTLPELLKQVREFEMQQALLGV